MFLPMGYRGASRAMTENTEAPTRTLCVKFQGGRHTPSIGVLEDQFAEYGSLERGREVYVPMSVRSPMAFVNFVRIEDAIKARTALNLTTHDGVTYRILFQTVVFSFLTANPVGLMAF